MKHWIYHVVFVLLISCTLTAQAAVKIVAAENVYGELAKQLGGKYVEVTSILTNPNQDPHLFAATPTVARQLTTAQVIIYNGAGYDSWTDKLIAGTTHDNQHIINIADLLNISPGANPHLWYQPMTMLTYAKKLADTLSKLDSKNQVFYQQQLALFQHNYLPFTAKIAELRHKYAGIPVLATEPVFSYMATALGLKMQGQAFQVSIMNDIEPTPSQMKEVENLILKRKIKVLFYNKQVINPITKHLQDLAKQQNIPVVGVTEIQPQGVDYLSWMMQQLNALELALQDVETNSN